MDECLLNEMSIDVKKTEEGGYNITLSTNIEGTTKKHVEATFDSEESLRRFKTVLNMLMSKGQ